MLSPSIHGVVVPLLLAVAMAKALVRTPETFFTAFSGGCDRTFPIRYGQLKMTAAPKPDGGRLWASFNGGRRKIAFQAKAEHNDGGNRDEGPQGVGLPDDLSSDMHGEYNNMSVNIWWDVGRCPPPLNFDISKIGSTVVEVMRRVSTSVCFRGRGIYFRVYGNLGELLPKMAKDTVRIISESGFKLAGFELKDEGSNVSDFKLAGLQRKRKLFSYVLEETLMIDDLIYHNIINEHPPPFHAIHMVILDRDKIITRSAFDLLLRNACRIILEPEQESVDGMWRWRPILPDAS